ncbi:MAG: hypothetical protein K2H23_07145 [Oscillospiraceae bacterium]|nr:hypothetical protein [Oscillospiraceae bacterium]
MNINYESLALFGKFGGAMLGLLLIVWLIALLTPKAAAFVDKISGKERPARVQDNIDTENNESSQENYKVYSVFEDRPNGAVNGTAENKDEK